MKKILILQPKIMHYRLPLFEFLSGDYVIDAIDLSTINDGGKNQLRGYNLFLTKYVSNLSNLCKNYDLVIAVFDAHWINIFVLPFLTDKPVIFWGHGVGKSNVINFFRRIVGAKAKALITYDETGKIKLSEIGIDSNKIFVAPNTIQVSNSSNYSSEAKNSILYVGRLQRRKELDKLLKSFALIRHSLPSNTKIKFVGDGEDVKSELIDLGKSLLISEKLEFFKGTSNEIDLANHFKSAYCYASPGPVGLGVLHSFAYGIPVITFKHRNHGPEVSNISDNVNSKLVDGGVTEYGEVLSWLIKSSAYSSMGNSAFQHYTTQRTMKKMIQSFVSAIEFSLAK